MTKRVQAGDTSEFAVAWAGVADPEPRSAPCDAEGSWGRFELWIRGRNLTEHRDRAEGLHDAVSWYLQPLISWLIALRFSIHDTWSPVGEPVDSGVEYVARGPAPEWFPSHEAEQLDHRLWLWRERHSLSAARQGGVVPEVVFRRVADDVEVSWNASGAPSRAKTRFLESRGCELLSMATFERTLSELKALVEPYGWALTRSESEMDVAPFHRALERAVPRADWWMDGQGRMGPVGLLAQNLNPDLDAAGAREFVRLARTANGDVLRALNPNAGQPAWMQGYEAALAIRGHLRLDGQALPDERELLRELGVTPEETEISDRSVRSTALSAAELDYGPVVAVNRAFPSNSSPRPRRASFLQGLGHLLLDHTSTGRVGFPHGSRWAARGRTRRANAFAAMLLAPPSALDNLQPEPNSIQDHCQRLGVSRRLLEKHAENLGRLPRGYSDQSEDFGDE